MGGRAGGGAGMGSGSRGMSDYAIERLASSQQRFGLNDLNELGTMKIKYKRRNCPRLQNAIKQAIHIVHEHCGGWWRIGYYLQRPDAFGELIFNIAYKADKYDVLNKLAGGCRRLAKAFIRADIRWERPTRLHTIGTLIIIFIFILTF